MPKRTFFFNYNSSIPNVFFKKMSQIYLSGKNEKIKINNTIFC